VTKLLGTPNAVTTSIAYEPTFNRVSGTTDPLGHTTSISYDSKGNPISIIDALGQTSTFAYNSAGQVTSITDPLGQSISFSYDGADITSIQDALGRTTTFFSDSVGRTLSRTNGLGQLTQYAYNALDELTKMTDPLGAKTLLTYDPNGNLQSVTDPQNTSNSTSYTYDNFDRVATRTDPLLNQETYQYDGNNNLIQFTDRRGKVTIFTPDALNRTSFAGFGKSGNSYESTITYTNDSGDRLTQTVDSASGTILRGYDGLDRLTSESGPQGSVSYTYDSAGRRATMTVAGQAAVNYTFDADDNLVQITQGASTAQMSHDAAGRRASLTLPNGILTQYTYDPASEIAGITYQLGGNVLGNLIYGYDLAGRRTQASGSFARSGLPQPLTGMTYNAANQLTQWNMANLFYDANGNMTSDGTHSYSWDARNHLSQIDLSSTASFSYDTFGRRISKTVLGVNTSFLYDNFNIVQELSGTSPTANLLTSQVDEVFQRSDSAGARSFLTDALGSTLALADSAGTMQTTYTFEPFGSTSIAGAGSSNAFAYTGRELDLAGLYFYRGRYFSPVLSRFAGQDPIGFSGGINLYAYVADNPIQYTDPFGFNKDEKGKTPEKDDRPPCGNQEELNKQARDAILENATDPIAQTGVKPDFVKGTVQVGNVEVDSAGNIHLKLNRTSFQGNIRPADPEGFTRETAKELIKTVTEDVQNGKRLGDPLGRAYNNAFGNCRQQ
jgi:RHS repeat-associated protein